jgi:hypothetical protein
MVVEDGDLFGFVRFRPLGCGNRPLTNFGSVRSNLCRDDLMPCVAHAGKPG